MKKNVLYIIVFLPFIAFSQNKTEEKINKNLIQLTVWDISGKETKGYLCSATDTSFIMSNIEKDSLMYFSFDEIYRLKVYRKAGLYNNVLSAFLVLEAINIEEAIRYEINNTVGFFDAFILGHLIVVTATLASVILADRVNFDYLVDSSYENYQSIYPVLEKWENNKYTLSLSEKFYGNEYNMSKKNIVRNDDNLIKIEQPNQRLNPERISRLNFYYSVGINASLSKKTFFANYSNNVFTNEIETEKSQKMKQNFGFSIRIYEKFRIGYNYNLVSYDEKYDYIYSFIRNSNNSVTFEYVLNPTRKKLTSRHEFSFGTGLGFSNVELTTNLVRNTDILNYYMSNNQFFKTFSGKIFSTYDFYLNRKISFQAKVSSDIYFPIKTESFILQDSNNSIKEFSAEKLKLTGFQFLFGLCFHF